MAQEIIDFWFSDRTSKRWFDSTAAFDLELRERFEDTWRRARDGELDTWCESPEGCLALAIILDQFPLNMFRGEGRSYSTEAQAREVAREAIAKGFDEQLDPARKAFLYMPFMHSEDMADQDYAVELYTRAGLESKLRFARHHRGIIEKFGRFPHRNDALGRDSTAAEIEYLNSKQAFTG